MTLQRSPCQKRNMIELMGVNYSAVKQAEDAMLAIDVDGCYIMQSVGRLELLCNEDGVVC